MFLDATVDEMLTDFWAHRFFEDPKAASAIEDEDFDADDVARQIGYVEPSADPDDWEDVR